MGINGRISTWMVNYNSVSIPADTTGKTNFAAFSSPDRVTSSTIYINAGVIIAPSAKGSVAKM
jgi:hypothetical protein